MKKSIGEPNYRWSRVKRYLPAWTYSRAGAQMNAAVVIDPSFGGDGARSLPIFLGLDGQGFHATDVIPTHGHPLVPNPVG
jgi:hypothetical protein